ncbi:MAG: tRNA (adenosine(37)-N6)-threonylcarbamoyltransferase complex ATPase subunit type 1 TsaE [Ilumatobacter coccineus]|uniref:tRNA threonylcarbamoyladenosine biosynthesis protein TsaE n=1 Tax=Ilumatobacter coccineus TaxID=467094 RepID=A0A2G6K9D4_9ACTN|nr:MAG: tRNA (adenosine(37)-N6)-threonylcarbamoyltransferase complex ATPase subunit type 1 TsaE [Ilumatobacter coccineus]
MLLCSRRRDDTHAIAGVVAAAARPGDVILLAGEMGAGKTTFSQGFGRALGITDPITSPTFTLVHTYPIPGSTWQFHHADLYRLDRLADVDDLGLVELVESDGIALVEWGDVAADAFGAYLQATFTSGPPAEITDDEFGLDGERRIEIVSVAGAWDDRWAQLAADLEAFAC